MRNLGKSILIGLALLSIGIIAFAVSMEQPFTGEPPYGLAIHGDAQGTKLVGMAVVEFTEYNPETYKAKGAKIIFRLRKGGDFQTFIHMINNPGAPDYNPNYELDLTYLADVQASIMNEAMPQVLEYFFQNPSLEVKIKEMSDFGLVSGEIGTAVTVMCGKKPLSVIHSSTSLFVVTDIVLAVS